MTDFQKSLIKRQKENFDKNYELLKTEFKLIENYEKTIFKETNLDLMFIMDLTGSMRMWLKEAKLNMPNIIEKFTDNNPGAKIRISFMVYIDYTEPNEKKNLL